MSFVVEIPSIFTKPTQIPVRLGNTILTGNETIEGSLAVNGSLTLNNGNHNGNAFYYDSLDISNTLSVGGDVTVGGSLSHKNDFAHFYIETDQGLSGSYYKIKNFLDGSLTGNAIRIDSSGGTTDNDLFVAQKTGYFKINGVFSYFNTTGTHRLSVRTQLYKNNSYANGNSEGYDYLRMVEGDYGSNVVNSIIYLTLGDSISVVASMNRGSGEGFNDDTNHLNLKSASVVFEYIGE